MPILWVFNYKCGCDSPPGRKCDVPDYCPKHGDDVEARYTQSVMSKRAARKSAYEVVGTLIQSYLDVGQPWEECNDHDSAHDWQPGDADTLTTMFEAIRDEMYRRAGGKSSP